MSELLQRHRPILRYDSQGSFAADSPAIMTNRCGPGGDPANLLRRADGDVLASAAGGRRRPRLELSYLGSKSYRDEAGVTRSDHLDALGGDYVLQAREMHRPEFADRVYGHEVPADDGGAWLQYWFFYLFNNKAFLGFGLHEGDWEMVQVRIGAGGDPQAMAFAQHTHGQRCAWDVVQKQGQRPVVYVARGSQASFPFAGRHKAPIVPDHADGKGREGVAGARGDRRRPPGLARLARALGLEQGAQRGRVQQPARAGPPGQVGRPRDLSRGMRRARSPHPPAGARPAGATRPEITVRREGDRAVVAYRFPRAPGAPAPAQLLVTLDAPGDGLPPVTDTQPVAGREGEVEHPLPLTEERYHVLVSAADEQGNVSEQAAAQVGR